MADAWQTYTVQFQGGLITNISPLQQAINYPGSATRLINYEPSVEGGYRRVQGFAKFDSAEVTDSTYTASGLIRGLHRYGSATYAVRGSYLYSSTGNGWVVINGGGASIGGSGKVNFANYNFDGNEKFVMCDDTGKPFVYDGSTFKQLTSLGTDFAGCSDVIVFKNQIFLVNDDKLFFSAPFQDVFDEGATDFSAASGGGVISIGADITDVIIFRDQLIIFTERSIQRLSGNTIADFRLDPISEDLGASVSGTVQEVGADIMFLGPDGIRTLGATDRIGDFNLGAVSRNIQSEITTLVRNSNIFSSLVIRAKSQYRLFGFNTGFQSDAALGILGTQYAPQGAEGMAWAETRGINAYVTHSSYETNREFILFANSDGYVYELERGNSFDSANIDSIFESPSFVFDDPRIRKTFYKLHLYTDPTGGVDITGNLLLDNPTTNRSIIQPESISLLNTTDGVFTYGASNALFVDGALTVGTTLSGVSSLSIDNISVDSTDTRGLVANDTFFIDGDTTEYTLTADVVITGTLPGTTTATLSFTPALASNVADNTQIRFVTEDSTTFGSGTFEEVFEEQLIGSGFSAAIRFAGNNTNPPYSLDTMTIEYIVNSRR